MERDSGEVSPTLWGCGTGIELGCGDIMGYKKWDPYSKDT
jgi:hypothetical protein